MHIYIYDTYINSKKYDSIIAKIETRITDLGLNGKIVRIGVMSSVFDSIYNEIKKGAKTIIAVGNSNIFFDALNTITEIKKKNSELGNIPLGFIPVGKRGNDFAQILGIEYEENACDILSARLIEKVDLGRANNNYFLFNAKIPTRGTILEIDSNYTIEINESGMVNIINIPGNESLPSEVISKANDGELELFIDIDNKKILKKKNNLNQSVFPFKNLRIINKTTPLLLDNIVEKNNPTDIEVAQEKIKLIVGKSRKFI